MQERELYPAEQVIESVDRVLAQLGWTPWAFRLEDDGTLVSDPDCHYFKREDEEEDFDENYEKKIRYQRHMWEEYGELFALSPFTLEQCEIVKELGWLDIFDMTWSEIIGQFLSGELPLVRKILRTDGFWHHPVPENISDEALNWLIAFRYKERLVRALEEEIKETEYEED